MSAAAPLLAKGDKPLAAQNAHAYDHRHAEPPLHSAEQAWYSFRWSRLRPCQLVEGHFVRPRTLFAVRLLVWLFLAFVLIVSVINFWKEGRWFFFFTNLTYFGLFIWQTWALILSYWHNFVEPLPEDLGRHDQGAHRFSPMHLLSLLSNMQPQAHLIVFLVFWLLLFSPADFGEQSNYERMTLISMHGVQFVLAMVDWSLTSVPIPSVMHLAPLFGTFVLYMFYTWVIHAGLLSSLSEDFWVYPFLEFGTSAAYFTYPGLLVAVILDFFLFRFLARKRSEGRPVLTLADGQGFQSLA